MKRFFSILCLLCLLCTLVACDTAPTPPSDEQTPAVPEGEPATSTVTEEESETAPENLLLDKSAKKHTGLLPRGFTAESETVQTLEGMKDKSFVAYVGWNTDRFSYTDAKGGRIGEKQWLQNLAKEYGASVTVLYKTPALALSAARVALQSGQKLDILGFSADQMWYAEPLSADLSTVLPLQKMQEMSYLNPSEIFGGRFLSPAAVSAGLWYQKIGIAEDPAILSKTEKWDFAAFSRYTAAAANKLGGKYAVGYHNTLGWNVLLDALGSPLLEVTKTGYATRFGKTETLPALRALQTLHASCGVYQTFLGEDIPQYAFGNKQIRQDGFNNDTPRPSLSKGTVGMLLADMPDGKVTDLGWAPLPESGSVVASVPVLALPKGETVDTDALALALTWTARYADAYHDTLRFTYGLSFADWQSLYLAAQNNIRFVPSDAMLSGALTEDWHLAVMTGSGNIAELSAALTDAVTTKTKALNFR